MILHAYTMGRNEAYMMPYYLRHYGAFCDRIFVLDDHSDDGTREIVQADPKATLLDYGIPGTLSEWEMGTVYTREWAQHSRGVADYVLFSDTDEFIYHPDIRALLAAQPRTWRSPNIFRSECYEMLSEAPPQTDKQLWEVMTEGVRNGGIYDKFCVVDPAWDIIFKPGRHGIAHSTPPSHWCSIGLKLLHFRYMGMDYMRARTLRNFTRMDLLWHYDYQIRKQERFYRQWMQAKARVV